MSVGLQERSSGVAQVLDGLGALRRSLLLPGEEAGLEVVDCSEAMTPAFVREHVVAYAGAVGTTDLAAAASIWCKYYDAAAQTAVLSAMTALGVGIDASPDRTGVVMRDGLPAALCLREVDVRVLPERLPTAGTVDGENALSAQALQQHVWRPLYGEQLQALVEIAADVAGVQRRVLWSNIASRAAHLLDHFAQDCRPATAAAGREDYAALLDPVACPWGEGRNPMRDPVRWMTLTGEQGPLKVLVRRTCCLKYRLPSRECCRSCPMVPAHERLARERREAAG